MRNSIALVSIFFAWSLYTSFYLSSSSFSLLDRHQAVSVSLLGLARGNLRRTHNAALVITRVVHTTRRFLTFLARTGTQVLTANVAGFLSGLLQLLPAHQALCLINVVVFSTTA